MRKFKYFTGAIAVMMLSACSVSTSSKSPLPDPFGPANPGGPNANQQGSKASAAATLSSLETNGLLVVRRELSGEMFLSNGSNIGRRRAEEIDVGITGGQYCMFNPGKSSVGSVMKVKRVQEGNIYTPARTMSGVKITFEDGGSLHLIRATY